MRMRIFCRGLLQELHGDIGFLCAICRTPIPRIASGRMSELQFTQHVNPVTGRMEWKAQNKDEYDHFKDVARSSYADMLHDTERNQMYYKAIKLAVQEMHTRGKKAKVLDIGTGTGLLSMMAATAGADIMTAIEVFEPMANVAKLITRANGFEKIHIINKHSTEVSVGQGEDMKERANILITELFDTELIGEGALEAYQHAHQNLMEEDCIAVPHSATSYVQLVESKLMHSWHSLNPIEVKLKYGIISYIEPDPRMRECPGVPAVHDIQLSQVQRSHFKEISDAVPVFEFKWGSRSLSSAPRSCEVTTKAKANAKAQVVLSWWTLSMDQKGEIILSTAPYWYHPTPNHMQWRDHWIQSVYFLPKPFDVSLGESICISAYHDAYSMWFDACVEDSNAVKKNESSRPACDYLPRMLWSRPRLGMLNDDHRNQCFVQALDKINAGFSEDHIAVCVSDVTLLPLLVAKTCFPKGRVFSLENDVIAQRGIGDIVKRNNLSDSITIISRLPSNDDESLFLKKSINLLVGEPFFNASLLPWHDLRFWYARSHLDSFLAEDACISPCRAHLCLAAVQFEDLWKIRAPVRTVEGFDVSIMDDMISHAMEVVEYSEPEPHALWEYPCVLLSEKVTAINFDFMKPVPSEEIAFTGCVELNLSTGVDNSVTCHGVVLWMEYDLDDEITISTGLLYKTRNTPRWNMHHKQAVFFLRQPITLETRTPHKIDYEVMFIPSTGDIKMKFKGGE